MDLDTKLAILDRIYKIYEDFVSGLDVACKRYCALCCTCNVTMTTLEGYRIALFLESNGQSDLYAKVRKATSQKRFQPKVTTNRLAELCEQGKDVPDEDSGINRGACPLLTNNECPIYPVRPFGCRCFVSRIDCIERGYAEIDPFVLTVNDLLLQYIEHVDKDGHFGNLTDVLLFVQSQVSIKSCRKETLKTADTVLIKNQPIKAILLPPEHKVKVKPILQALQSIKISKTHV